jgi:hypothetical protein
MPNEEKLDACIALADDLCTATKAHIERSMAVVRERGYVLKVRDEVILALGLKIDSAFRALIDDARLRRTEALHHLKTIVEAFIFMFVVAKDETDLTAERVLAEVCAEKEKYLRLNPEIDTPTGEHLAYWAQELRDYEAANIHPIGPWRMLPPVTARSLRRGTTRPIVSLVSLPTSPTCTISGRPRILTSL